MLNIINLLGQKKIIISFRGPAALHFHVLHLSFYSVNLKKHDHSAADIKQDPPLYLPLADDEIETLKHQYRLFEATFNNPYAY